MMAFKHKAVLAAVLLCLGKLMLAGDEDAVNNDQGLQVKRSCHIIKTQGGHSNVHVLDATL